MITTNKKLLLGISVRKPPTTPEQDEQTKSLFKGVCDFCGVPIAEHMRFTHHHHGGWYNSCTLCFHYEHLDLIPHYRRGEFVYWNGINQEQFNIFYSCIWSMQHIERQFDVDIDYEENVEEMRRLEKAMEYKAEPIKSFFMGGDQKQIASVSPDVVANYLNVLSDEDYHQRHKMFSAFLWVPPKVIFKDEIAYWAKNAYGNMNSDSIKGLMSSFSGRFGLEVSNNSGIIEA